MKRILLSTILLFMLNCVNAQTPLNTNCEKAISMTVMQNNTQLQTVNLQSKTKLYYSFKATTSAATIYVNLLNQSLFVGFSDNCDTANFQFKASSYGTPLTVGNLVIGKTYYYRIELGTIAPNSTLTHGVVGFTPAVNDECSGAILVTQSAVYTPSNGSLLNATPSFTDKNPDVWFKFVATSTAVKIQNEPTGTQYAEMSLYDSCGGKKINYSNNNFLIQDNLILGKTYYYSVHSYYSNYDPATTTFKHGVTPLEHTNISCKSAKFVTTNNTYTPSLVKFTSLNVTQLPLVFSFVATSTAVEIKFDCANVSSFYFRFDECGTTRNYYDYGNSATYSGLTIGKTYSYIVILYGIKANSTLTHGVVALNPAVNDECSGAISVTPATTFTPSNGNFINSSPSIFTSKDNDVWYKFVATSNAVKIQVNPTNFTNANIFLYDSCGGNYIAQYKTANQLTQGGLVIGKTYYYRIYSYYSPPSNASFTHGVIALTSTPVNDECVNATLITVQNTVTASNGTLLNSTESKYNAGNDVWYKFTPNSNAVNINLTPTSEVLGLEVFSVCNSKRIAYIVPSKNKSDVLVGGLISGQTYMYRIYSTSTVSNTSTFAHGVTKITNTPANDECTNATLLTVNDSYLPIQQNFNNATTSFLTSTNQYYAGYDSSYVDLWYSFVANSTAINFKTESVNSTYPIYSIALYSQCGNQISDYNFYYTSNLIGGFVIGQKYYLRIYATKKPGIDVGFKIGLSKEITAPNDECEGALEIVPTPTYTPTLLVDFRGTSSYKDRSILWYKFTATDTIAEIHGGICVESSIQFYKSCNTPQVAFAYNDPLKVKNLTIGSTYYYTFNDGLSYMCDGEDTENRYTCVIQKPLITGLLHENTVNELNFYPNPANNQIVINEANVTTQIFTLWGELVLKSDIEKIDISSLKSGVYILKLRNLRGSTKLLKLIKE